MKNQDNQPYNILVSAEKIQKRLEQLGKQINMDYENLKLDLVCLTNAAMPFAADLMRLLAVPTQLHAMAFTSYESAPQSGEVRITLDIGEPMQDRHLLVMEGMVISGRTPLYLMNLLRLRRPASLELCAIGIKPKQLAVELPVKYRLFEFDNEWVCGYGIGHGPEKALADLINLQE